MGGVAIDRPGASAEARGRGCATRVAGSRYDPAHDTTGYWSARNIGAPATRALIAAGYTELRQLANVPASELKKLHGMGPRALKLLQEALEQQGMSLG